MRDVGLLGVVPLALYGGVERGGQSPAHGRQASPRAAFTYESTVQGQGSNRSLSPWQPLVVSKYDQYVLPVCFHQLALTPSLTFRLTSPGEAPSASVSGGMAPSQLCRGSVHARTSPFSRPVSHRTASARHPVWI